MGAGRGGTQVDSCVRRGGGGGKVGWSRHGLFAGSEQHPLAGRYYVIRSARGVTGFLLRGSGCVRSYYLRCIARVAICGLHYHLEVTYTCICICNCRRIRTYV